MPAQLRYKRRALVEVGLLLLGVLALYLIHQVSQVLLIVFAGVLFGVLLDGAARLIYHHSPVPRRLALLIVGIVGTLVIVGVLWFIGPKVADQLNQLIQQIPQAVERVRERLSQLPLADEIVRSLPQPEDWGREVMGRIASLFSTTFSALGGLVIVLFVGVYLAISPRHYVRAALFLLPPARRRRGEQVFEVLGYAMRRWLAGRLASMAVVGVLTTLALWAVGLPLAVSLGIIAGLLSFIPYLGPILSAAPAVLIGLAEGPQMALYVVLIYIGVQTVESYLITPLIEKRAVHIPPAFGITAQLVMGVLAGFMGLLLATPLAVVATVLVQMLYIEGELGDESVPVLGEDRLGEKH